LPTGASSTPSRWITAPKGLTDFSSASTTCGATTVAMEGYNGWARPLDGLVQRRHYRLFNVNNLKLARLKEIFPTAAKTDQLDARKGLGLFQLCDHLPLTKRVSQEVDLTPSCGAQAT